MFWNDFDQWGVYLVCPLIPHKHFIGQDLFLEEYPSLHGWVIVDIHLNPNVNFFKVNKFIRQYSEKEVNGHAS